MQAVVEFSPENENSQAGITVFHTNEHHYDLLVTRKKWGKGRAAEKTRRGYDNKSQPVYVPEKTPLALFVQASKLEYIFPLGLWENL